MTELEPVASRMMRLALIFAGDAHNTRTSSSDGAICCIYYTQMVREREEKGILKGPIYSLGPFFF